MKIKYKIFYLVGAGGYGKQLYFMLKKNKIVETIKFVDNKTICTLDKFFKIKKKLYFNISIGSPIIRENIYLKSLKNNFFFGSLIFPNINIYSNDIKEGCIIEPNTFVANSASIGVGNFIFYGSTVAHNSIIGNFCNLGTNAVISGNVIIGNRVQIGGNSFISNNVEICSDVIISPGSVILKHISEPGVYKDNLRIK